MLLLGGCSDKLDPNQVKVTGTMIWINGATGNTVNGTPVSGATVSFYPAGSGLRDKIGQATTDSQGKFSYAINPGSYDIVAFKGGSTASTLPPGSSSKSNVNVPDSKKGMSYDVGNFLY